MEVLSHEIGMHILLNLRTTFGLSLLCHTLCPLNVQGMAEQDIREDQMTVASSVDYLRGLKGKDSVLIKKDDLVHITPKLGFNGDFKDPANFPKAGLYIYEVNTSSSGTFNGPDGNNTFYGIVEIISRIAGNSNGLNVVTIKAYSHDMIGFMLIGKKSTGEDTYNWGEWKQIY